ncbi:MAG: nitroreductase [Bacteroidetes bacterium HGW-Bacteroidetes-15]|nr:MAG: nitroreductase [Bacteroidetes bacterium HGW-Bacteroidetes-15]
MMRKLITLFVSFIFLFNLTSCGQEKMIKLPEPKKSGGMPLMDALAQRKTSRAYSPKELDLQTLSNLLWAANGINRPENGLKTAPSAVNWQEIDVYVSLEKGVYIYNAIENTLELYMKGDIREATGRQPFVKDVPVNLIYVADFTRMGDRAYEVKHWYSAADAAFIAQNVYLFCASENLATVVRGAVEKEELKKVMNLPEHMHVVLCQSVGYHGE